MVSISDSPWIIGCGDVGRRIVRRLVAAGVTPLAVVRGEPGAAAAREAGAHTRRADLDDPAALDSLDLERARVIYLVPPPRDGTRDSRLRAFLDRQGERIARLVLVSTTGVYGDCDGAWIDEETPPAPQTDRGRRRLDAERAVADWSARTRGGYIVLRVPGIYAGDRLPEARLREGLPVLCEAESGYTNRIHADDLARVCLAALDSSHDALVLNATDGHPTRMTTYFLRVADALGLPRPPEVSLEEARSVLSPAMLSYALESRRIGNRRLLETLGITLDYPDLDSTLASRRTTDTTG